MANPFWPGVPYDPNYIPPEAQQQLMQLLQARSNTPLQPQAPPQAPQAPQAPMMAAPGMQAMPQSIQIPDVDYGEAAKKQALKQALFMAGANLLAGMKPTALPQSPLANIGQAAGAGMQAYQGAQNNAMERYKTLAAMKGPRDYTQTKEIYDENTRKTRIMGWNPDTNRYDVDMGLAPPPASHTPRPMSPSQTRGDFNRHIGLRQSLYKQLSSYQKGTDWLGEKIKPEILKESIDNLMARISEEEAYLELNHPSLYKSYMSKEPLDKKDGKKVVERRKTKDGRTLVKYEDGSIGEE